MTFLPIVERELRVASRRKVTYQLRFLLALVVFVLWCLVLALNQRSSVSKGTVSFMAIGILSLGFSLLAGVFLTADSLSEEKREGTLGLLFLTDLKGHDVVLGKLMATSLNSFYGLLAVFPLLGLPLLMGGVTGGEFGRVTLVLVSALLLSLSAGMLVSAWSRDTRQAMAATFLLLLMVTGLLPAVWWLQHFLFPSAASGLLLWPSPVYLYVRAFDASYATRGGPSEFATSLAVILGLALAALALASLHLPRVWHERGSAGTGEPRTGWRRRWRFGTPERCGQRRRWLEQDPFFWLATRDRLPRWLAFGALGPLAFLWLSFVAGSFSRSGRVREMCIGVSFLVAFGVHQVFKCLLAIESSRRLSDDRHSGALELLLVTPLPARQIFTGQRHALTALFRGPLLLVLAINLGLLWLIFSDASHLGKDDRVIFCEMALGGAVMLWVDSYALSWVGMRMALQTQRHHRAIFATLARVILPAWIFILLVVLTSFGRSGLTSETVQALTLSYFLLTGVLALGAAAYAKTGLEREVRK